MKESRLRRTKPYGQTLRLVLTLAVWRLFAMTFPRKDHVLLQVISTPSWLHHEVFRFMA